jgi:hypothetical protein
VRLMFLLASLSSSPNCRACAPIRSASPSALQAPARPLALHSEREQLSGNSSPEYDPLHRLARDLCDELVVTVVMQNGDTLSFCHCGD